jgi:hypothetical protein
MEPQNFERQPGRRMQVGGALALGLGILLLIFLPASSPGAPINVHRISYAFIAIGLFGIVAGTIGRKLLL